MSIKWEVEGYSPEDDRHVTAELKVSDLDKSLILRLSRFVTGPGRCNKCILDVLKIDVRGVLHHLPVEPEDFDVFQISRDSYIEYSDRTGAANFIESVYSRE